MARWLMIPLALFSLAACNLPVPAPAAAPSCGDGLCAAPETAGRCPADCPEEEPTTAAPTDAAGPKEAAPQADAPLYLTTMTHMEGGWNDDKAEGVFQEHVAQLRFGMDLAEEYGALLTIESEQSFARASARWGVNILAEARDRGFGVGTHCDFGFRTPVMPVEDYARFFAENKRLVDDLVGAESNQGCSGGGSANDWARAAALAGFGYIDGVVSMHYLSMPPENRPGSEWTDAFIQGGNHHFNAPIDFWQRLYPFGVADAEDFLADPDPVIVVNSGELGALATIAEGTNEYSGKTRRAGDYPLDRADVDRLVEIIHTADQGRDRTRVAKLAVYLPANIFVEENEDLLRYFFSEMRALEEQGMVEWATQLQVYQAYMDRTS